MTPRQHNSLLGANIQTTREAAKMSRAVLADKAGMSPARLYGCERGHKQIRCIEWAAIAAALGVAPSSLLPNVKARARRAA
jgi:transcriptional regulator with XRE-family HTH domain